MTDLFTSTTNFEVFACKDGDKNHHTIFDALIEEVPVEIRYNGQSYAVLMATPEHLAELAVGFSLSEDIIHQYAQIDTILVQEHGDGFVVDVGVIGTNSQRLKDTKRNMAGRTGCGLCGLEKLADLPEVRRHIRADIPVPLVAIKKALQHFDTHQPLHMKTGAVHGAALVSLTGDIHAVFEDVGRHNALDKLIGWGARHKVNWEEGFLLISSRASFEMVQKAANTGVGLLVAISAPTARGVRLAKQYNLALVGFARPEKMVLYSYPERVLI